MTIQWTDDDKERLKTREVIIFQQNLKEKDINDKGLPNDVHLIEYSQNGEDYCDAVRASKMSDIFDAYHDKIHELGGVVTAIKSGFGTVNPKFYTQPDKKKG